jgi:hypothetical protein
MFLLGSVLERCALLIPGSEASAFTSRNYVVTPLPICSRVGNWATNRSILKHLTRRRNIGARPGLGAGCPDRWSRIARTVATEKGLNQWENARLFALLNMALADGYIAMAASKNDYNFWRPVTAIHSGGDTSWTPLVPTPPDQDYPSGHSIEGGVGLRC